MNAQPFLWGAATAPHQVEGNNINSDLWLAETSDPPLLPEASGAACDSYHRWPEDLDIVKQVGLNAYRFGIEWARIEPRPGEFDRNELAHYRAMIEGCLERGLEPVVTLHHFSCPAWFRLEGGWTHPDAVRRFASYVEAVRPILAGVSWVCTINEPNMVAVMSTALRDGGVPTMGQMAEADPHVSRALAEAHRAAREVLSASPSIRSGWTIAVQNAQPSHEAAAEAAETWSYGRERFFLEVAREDDFVGIQAYTRTIIDEREQQVPVPEGVARTLMGWEYYPAAIGEAVRHAAEVVGPVPILVTENGIATSDDEERIRYTDDALAGLAAAIRDGVDVRGYLHWSLLDNFEWGSWTPTFGLVAVDRTTFERTVKPSAYRLGEHAAREDWPA